jgi:hypothetical protein
MPSDIHHFVSASKIETLIKIHLQILELVHYVMLSWITETLATHQAGWFDVLKPL